MISMKYCKRCSTSKLIGEFSSNKSKNDGLSNWCKLCNVEDAKIRRARRGKVDPDLRGTKRCARCDKDKSRTEFNTHRDEIDGLSYTCRECTVDIRHKKIDARRDESIDYLGTKRCKQCGIDKPKIEFYVNLELIDRLTTYCKSCYREQGIKWREAFSPPNYEDIPEYIVCGKCRTNTHKSKYTKNKTHTYGLSTYCKSCKSVMDKEYRQNNAEKVNEGKARWTRNNRVKVRGYKRKWAEANPEKMRSKAHRRRMKIKILMSSEDIVLSIEWRKVIKYDPCMYCGLIKDRMHDDHYIPIAIGGTDHWWNIVRACSDCNHQKSIKHGDVFIELNKCSGFTTISL